MGTFFTTHRPGHSQPPKLKQGPGASRPNTRKSFSADQARYVAARSVASPGTTRRAKFWRRSRHKTKRRTPNTEYPMLKSEANPADVATIDSIITAAYDGISGPAGKKRDWDRERSLYMPGARLIPTAMEAGTGGVDLAPHILDIEGYIARVEPFFEKSGFYEREIARRTEQFGQIAHVWSTYESCHNETAPEPFMRGINSIQLFYDDRRWWIVTVYWQHESRESPIPKTYLGNGE